MKKIAHVQVMKIKYKINIQDIIAATGMGEQYYYDFQFNQAIDWIKLHTFNDDDIVNVVLEKPEFRMWWLNLWNMRDDAFVSRYFEQMTLGVDNENFLKKMWEATHKIESIKAMPPDSLFENVIKTITNRMNKQQQTFNINKHERKD